MPFAAESDRLRGALAAVAPALVLALALLITGPAGSALAAGTRAPGARPSAAGTAAKRAAGIVSRMTTGEKLDLAAGGAGGVPRLGVPPLAFTDGPNGIAGGQSGVTAFPTAISIAGSWSAKLAKRYGDALGAEARAKGRDLIGAPTINIIRTPRWGRSPETLGEDPLLAARLAVAEVRAIQRRGVISEVKHFAANNQETERFGDPLGAPAVNEIIPERALHEIYYPAFAAAVGRGKAASVMCAYVRINGEYACQSRENLDNLDRFGLRGFVEPDASLAVRDVIAAANAGVDNFQLGSLSNQLGTPDRTSLAEGLAAGTLDQARLDRMATDILTAMIRVGLLEDPPSGGPDSVATGRSHRRLATRISEQGTVLLKNRGRVLPLEAGGSGHGGRDGRGSIAVIGHDAGPGTQIEEGGSPAVVPGRIVTPLAAIRRRAERAGVRVRHAPGTLGVVGLPIVPASALRPASGSGEGLTGTYYSGTGFEGAPIGRRLDPGIDFESQATPLQAIPGTGARSARWSGTLVPPKSGVYRFSLQQSGNARLYIDGRLIAGGSNEFYSGALGLTSPANPISLQGTVRLEAGRPVPIRVDYSTGPSIGGAALHLGWQPPRPSLLRRAVAAARRAKVAVVFANDVASEGMDRPSLRLPGDQDALIRAVARANPRTVVVLHTAGPVLMPWRKKVAGILEAWYPGQQSGAAIAHVLFGDADPGGRLPVTFPASGKQGPATRPADFPGVGGTVRYSEGIQVGYRYYDAHRQRPLYPFGYGLSYARFSLGGLKVRKRHGNGGRPRYVATVPVRNVGSRTGSTVIQLYLGFPRGAHEPPLQLKAFEKVRLRPGRRRKVHLGLGPSSFRTWDASTHSWRIAPGAYRVRVGTSSRDLPRRGRIGIRSHR